MGIVIPDFAQAQNGGVQSYADQAVPPVFYDSPLAAGTLTLQDVLEAHKAPAANLPTPGQLTVPGSAAAAPLLTPTLESSATSLMMEQGMKSVLQKTGDASVQVTPPVVRASTAQGQPAPLLAGVSAPTPEADTSADTVAGVKYEPGQAPKNLASVLSGSSAPAATSDSAAVGIVATAAPSTDAATPAAASCDPKTRKWEKTCVEAGYPATFVGKIVGETRVGCADGVLHDFWVANTCAPSDGSALAASTLTGTAAASVSSDTISDTSVPATPETHDASASTSEFCGPASEILAYEAPLKDLCRVGTASAVNGDGPWTWSCTDNDGRASSCRTLALSGDDAAPAQSSAAPVAAPVPAVAIPGAAPAASMAATMPPAQAATSMLAVPPVSAHASAFASSASVELACGMAASQPATQAPDQDLCENGKASAVRGHGPWHWTCSKGKHKLSCETAKSLDASCGSSNGATLESAPFLGLCALGTPTSVSGNGPWNWSCNGSGGGVSVACAATAKNKDQASSAPSTQSPSSVDGICGSADGVATFVKPADELCLSGVVGTVASLGGKGNGPWTWNCGGVGGGHTATCAAPLPGNTDGSDATPIPKASKKKTAAKAFPAAPTPTTVPPSADVTGIEVPFAAPALSDDSQPLTPPAIKDAIAPAPVLQDDATIPAAAPSSGGSHLSLDPTISTILFTRGSGAIDNQVLTTLDKLAAVLQANADVRIILTAYADSARSTPRDARRLSLTRALAVRDYLGSKGISDSRIDVRAEGANTTGYIDRVDVRVND